MAAKVRPPKFKGNKNSGRKPRSVEMSFFVKLDAALPKAVELCENLIDEYNELKKEDISKIEDLAELKNYWTRLKSAQDAALKATQIMFSKAPQRIENPNPTLVKIIDDEKYAKIIKRESGNFENSSKEQIG
jgi:hypothetical protein